MGSHRRWRKGIVISRVGLVAVGCLIQLLLHQHSHHACTLYQPFANTPNTHYKHTSLAQQSG